MGMLEECSCIKFLLVAQVTILGYKNVVGALF